MTKRDRTKRRVEYRIERRKVWLIEQVQEGREKVVNPSEAYKGFTRFIEGQILGLECAIQQLQKNDALDIFLED